jgi:hypothetical protein
MYPSVGPYNVHLVLYDGWRRRGEEHYSQEKVPDKAISIVPGPLFLECPTSELWWLGTGHVVRCPLTFKCQLGPATPSTPTTYAHLGQTLTPVCYRGHLPCSLLPFWCVTRLSSLFIIKIEENLQAPQVLLSAPHIMKCPVLPVLKVELAGFWEVLGLHNMA